MFAGRKLADEVSGASGVVGETVCDVLLVLVASLRIVKLPCYSIHGFSVVSKLTTGAVSSVTRAPSHLV